MLIRIFTLALLLASYTSSFATDETPVQIIPLAPPLNQPSAEISGMAWCADTLILMPQYPRRFSSDKTSFFYTLDKQSIVDFLAGKNDKPLKAQPLRLKENGLRKKVAIFDGFEAISCKGSDVWLAIEAVNIFTIYQSYLVKAELDVDAKQSSINIDSSQLWSLDSQSEMRNMGDEAILLNGDQVISLHEVNDPKVVKNASAHVLNSKTQTQTTYRFPHLPFRITDSTELDDNSRFWVMNYKYSGDKFSRKSSDPLAEQYGEGESHKQYYNVERLVEFELDGSAIKRVDRAPIQLLMESVEGRNWEGLVRLDELGFLIATDKHPETLFGFVPLKTKERPHKSLDPGSEPGMTK